MFSLKVQFSYRESENVETTRHDDHDDIPDWEKAKK
jgi:hypothetical protein